MCGSVKKNRPAKCWGPEASKHQKGCRPARPLCRWMRRVKGIQNPCMCDAYHHTHRKGSGRCGNAEAQEAFAHGPLPIDADARAAAPIDADAPSGPDPFESFGVWFTTAYSEAAE
jgi:hypothetical protein